MKIVGLIGLIALAFALAPTPPAAAADGKRAARPLSVDVYKKRYRGGYSVRKSDTIDTRRFVDPTLTRQSQGGPFDEGFFFETPRGAFGGSTPYFY